MINSSQFLKILKKERIAREQYFPRFASKGSFDNKGRNFAYIRCPRYACSDTQRDTKFIARRKMQDASLRLFSSEQIQVRQRGIPALTVYQWYDSLGILGDYNAQILTI